MAGHVDLLDARAGGKKLLEQHGDSLVCVRYLYDAVNRIRIKTVEIIVEKKGWAPPQGADGIPRRDCGSSRMGR